MGYDQHRQSGSWGILSCIGAVAVLFIVGLGIVALIGVGVAIWQGFGGVPQVAVVKQQAAVELHELEEIESDGMVPLQRQVASFADSSDPRLNLELNLDREGNASVDGEEIGLDKLRARLVKLKGETSNAFVVHIIADPECPAKHIIPVLDVCEEVGDIDYRVASRSGTDLPIDEGDAP
jgi:biopolymer transport protein ExbD